MLRALKRTVQSFTGPAYQAEVNEPQFTPDVAKLESYYFQNVFICNQFMRGCSKFRDTLEGNCVKQFSGFTHDKNFVMWMKDLGRESVVFPMQMGPEQMFGKPGETLFGPMAKLLGNVYTMRADQIFKLDELHENGIQFVRSRIKIDIPFVVRNGRALGDLSIQSIPAWAYIGNVSYWSEVINPTSKVYRPVSLYKAKADGDPYYFYSEKREQSRR